jgi:hypothetical protein
MKRILFITSLYRTGERIYPIIPHLAKDYKMDLLKIYQMMPSYKWVGDIDMRLIFDNEYLKYFDNVFEGSCDVSKYDLIISDDNRNNVLKTNLKAIYNKKNCPMVCFEHGNNQKPLFQQGHKVVFDKCFVFGKKDVIHEDCIAGGIPANDKLKEYLNLPKKHILVIVNFLGNRTSPFAVNFDKKLFEKIDIKSIQNYFNLPVVIKLKSRADEGGYTQNLKYLKSILPTKLDYTTLIDVEDDNKLIAESECVISAPSTLAFKSIQIGVNTILINGSGQNGSFYDYKQLLPLGADFLSYLIKDTYHSDWVENSIEGGLLFNSTQIVINKIKELL